MTGTAGGEAHGFGAVIGGTLDRGDGDAMFDFQVEASWHGGSGINRQGWELRQTCFMFDGHCRPVAGFVLPLAGGGWLVTLQGEAVMADGFTWREARKVEDKEGPRALPGTEFLAPLRLQAADGWRIVRLRVPADFVTALAGTDEPGNPNGEPVAGTGKALAPAARFPPHLATWACVGAVDLRAPLRERGIPLEDGDFVAYEPVHSTVLASCRKPETLDLVEAVADCRLGPCCTDYVRSEFELKGGNDGPLLARGSVAGNSGGKSEIRWTKGKDRRVLGWVTEPVISNRPDLIDMRHGLLVDATGNPQQQALSLEREAALVLAAGKEFRTDFGTLPDGSMARLTVRCSVERAEREEAPNETR